LARFIRIESLRASNRCTPCSLAVHRERQGVDRHRFVHESLIELCDLLGETLAEETTTPTASSERIREINVLVWKLRWELGMTGGHPVSLAGVESEAAE
jgi:hypothetical protein